MYLNFVSFNLQTDLSEKAVSIQRYRSAAIFIRLCGKNRVHGHAVELQFRAHKMLAMHVHVYICIRFTHYICDLDWLIIFPKAFCANIRYQKIQLLKTKHDAFFAVQLDLFHFIFIFTFLGNPRPVSHYIIW